MTLSRLDAPVKPYTICTGPHVSAFDVPALALCRKQYYSSLKHSTRSMHCLLCMPIFFITLRFLNSTDHCVANPQEGYNAVIMSPITMWVLESLIDYCGKATRVIRVSSLG